MDSVRTDLQNDTAPDADKTVTVCKLCVKNAAKYTCPRCKVQYCSVDCYKSNAHMQCSESFYRDCFVDGLKGFKPSDEEKKKTLEMLQRVEEEFPISATGEMPQEEEDLEDRLEGLDLDRDAAEVWNRLTTAEKEEFERLLQEGHLGNLIELEEPWWKKKSLLVQEMDTERNRSTGTLYPKVITVPSLSQLMKGKQPSANLPHDIVNLLYAYAYVMRLHNTGIHDIPEMSVEELCQLSGAFQGKTYSDLNLALHDCFHCLQTIAQDLLVSQAFSIAVLEDVKCLIIGPGQSNRLQFVVYALSDIDRLISNARRENRREAEKSSNQGSAVSDEEKAAFHKKTFNLKKKVEFYTSWVSSCGEALLDLLPTIELELCSLTTELAQQTVSSKRFETHRKNQQTRNKPSKLVVELS